MPNALLWLLLPLIVAALAVYAVGALVAAALWEIDVRLAERRRLRTWVGPRW